MQFENFQNITSDQLNKVTPPLCFHSNFHIALYNGGGGGADVGECGDFMGTLQQISALVVGEMWGLRFLNALLSGFDCSFNRWQDGGGEEEGMFSNPLFFVYQTDHPSKICTYL